MSDPTLPTVTHASHGGHFNVLTEDVDQLEDRRHQTGDKADEQDLLKAPILLQPNFRIWETVGVKTTSINNSGFKFKVLSYNVLAQLLLEWHPYLYTKCHPHNLKWDIRATRLYEEITSYSPDILCLQEVQASHLSTFYSKFEQIGYSGIFKQKTGEGIDGCAIYFKKSLFELQDHVNVEFYQPELPILNRDNIGILVKLIPRSSAASPIVVATTHLLYNPKRTDVRLAQIQVFLAEIDRFAFFNNGNGPGRLPIILTGDFNSTPDDAVIQLLDKGYVNASPYRDSSDWRRIGVTDNCQHLSVSLNWQSGHGTDIRDIAIKSEYCLTNSKNQPPSPDCFSNYFNGSVIGYPLDLTSVYDKVKSDGSHEATTFQDCWVTVDYIYYSRCSYIQLVERLCLPTALQCKALGSLPNDIYGSDHLALAATFELTS